uniref:chitin synthase n=1 Tax=Caenorhabditis japonica TaxID=281687 RepID=A0A8R1DIP0_CAEJA
MEDMLQKDPFGEKLLSVAGHDMNQTQIEKFQTRINEMIEMANRESGYYAASQSKAKPKKQPKAEEAEQVDADEYVRRAKRSVGRSEGAEAEEPEEEEFSSYNIYSNYVERNQLTMAYDALWLVIIQFGAVFVCYHSSKFACKVMMQRMGFALPMALSVPVTVFLLSTTCKMRTKDSCHLTNILTVELFWQCKGTYTSFSDFLLSPQTWIWLCWLASQFWITIHLWNPKHERLAKSEKLFILPYYIGAFVDQSLAFNRRRDDKAKIKAEDLEFDTEDSSLTYETIPGLQTKTPPSVCSASSSKMEHGMIRDSASSADAITKIYACATMWHETSHEMTCMLKSLFRMDEDQCARRNAQKYLKVIDPDYYEFEAHIFFDDAFDINEYGEPEVNKFVKQIVNVIDQAASAVHQTQMRLKPPKKAKTPYGGKLTYIMPGKNKLFIHLKDNQKIRHRKRWSQVMYLYYLLGYRLMMKVDDPSRKEVISENTFILTLDGDVDFTPQSVYLLVDLMKKNRRLGAACGRIHPRGDGAMVWYQKFEYAVGHWLQKATEHMIGCVMCSPGCFSLFRAYALMDDNVARRYALKSEEPKHFIQYDQGEDRWLCTLLLQRGYRVEYCAASDAQTFAPEGFNEFFNQRRRWIPSTIFNIMDLLKDYKNVVSVNESISIWYIIYQLVMLISSILGPGTIFVMVVGAISISFTIDTMISLVIVSIPVIIFIAVCLTSKPEHQLICAQTIGAIFAMLMTAVIVGTSLQLQKDGLLSPHSMFMVAVVTSFMTAAILHPLEFTCIIPGTIYFLAIPCMYMLLPIYSVCNMHTVAWGTREDPRPTEKNALAKRPANLETGIKEDLSSGCSRFLCCGRNTVDPMSVVINEKINEVIKKVERIERKQHPSLARRASILSSTGGTIQIDKCSEADEDEQAEIEDALEMSNQSHAAKKNQKWKQAQSEAWLADKALKRAEREFLEPEEESFWNDVIEKYLSPLVMDGKDMDRLRAGLIAIRNSHTVYFLMINVVFIITVLVLQIHKDCLNIEWPIGPKYNHTVRPCYASHDDSKEEIWVMTRLQLEPIGLVFLMFFVSILIIQFLAMLCHRFGTLAHIIASTELFCFRKTMDRLSEDELVAQNAVEIARELQAIRGIDENAHQIDMEDDVDATGASMRGPAQRRLERLFTAQQDQSSPMDANRRKSNSRPWEQPSPADAPGVELRRF